jgi:hypothetical protein
LNVFPKGLQNPPVRTLWRVFHDPNTLFPVFFHKTSMRSTHLILDASLAASPCALHASGPGWPGAA